MSRPGQICLPPCLPLLWLLQTVNYRAFMTYPCCTARIHSLYYCHNAGTVVLTPVGGSRLRATHVRTPVVYVHNILAEMSPRVLPNEAPSAHGHPARTGRTSPVSAHSLCRSYERGNTAGGSFTRRELVLGEHITVRTEGKAK